MKDDNSRILSSKYQPQTSSFRNQEQNYQRPQAIEFLPGQQRQQQKLQQQSQGFKSLRQFSESSLRIPNKYAKPSEQKIFDNNYYLNSIKISFENPFKEDYFSRLYRDHFYQTYQGIYFSKFLKSSEKAENKKIQLPLKDKNKITLIFDLDETLVHCNESLNMPNDIIINIKTNTNETIQAGVNIRPYASEILKNLSKEFEIIVFTASHECYASKVLDFLDPNKNLVPFRFYREHCIQTQNGMYIKDLRIFADRPLEQMVLIDNAAYCYGWQVDNGIPIIPFYDRKDDKELFELEKYLKAMKGCSDVRMFNRQYLKLHLFNEPQGPLKVFEKIFGIQMNEK